MNALTDKRGALYPLTQSQKRTAAAIPTLSYLESLPVANGQCNQHLEMY
jgi:hypothetical protein